MPPVPSQKGTGKKGSGIVRQRSRNTTPNAAPAPPAPGTAGLPQGDTIETDFIKDLKFESLPPISYEDLVEAGASNANIPDSKSLDGLIARLTKIHDIIEGRGTFCDRGMRLVAGERSKMHFEDMSSTGREDEKPHRDDDEKKANKKKRKATDSLAPGDAKIGKLKLCRYYRRPQPKPPKSTRSHLSARRQFLCARPTSSLALGVVLKKKISHTLQLCRLLRQPKKTQAPAAPRRTIPSIQPLRFQLL